MALLMPCLRHSSAAGMPASPSYNTATIWLAVNLLFFKGISDLREAPKFYRLVSTWRGSLRAGQGRCRSGLRRLVANAPCSPTHPGRLGVEVSVLCLRHLMRDLKKSQATGIANRLARSLRARLTEPSTLGSSARFQLPLSNSMRYLDASVTPVR